MRGIFQLAAVPAPETLDDLQEALQRLPGVTDVVVRGADGTVFVEYAPERIRDTELVATLTRLGYPVARMATVPRDLSGDTMPADLMEEAAGFPGGPVARAVRTAEIRGFDVDEAMQGEANQAKFPGHSTG